MSSPQASKDWLAHPLAGELLRFNFLPSTLLHPSRRAEWDEVTAHLPPLHGLHRHWSAHLEREGGFEPVLDLHDPALPLALLPAPRFDALELRAGAVLLAAPICRTVLRQEVAALREQLGDDVLALARTRAGQPDLLAGVEYEWQPARARELCMRLGAGLLALALETGAPEVASRGLLRLPLEVADAQRLLARAGLQPPQALALAREIVQLLEPAWLSSFPAPH